MDLSISNPLFAQLAPSYHCLGRCGWHIRMQLNPRPLGWLCWVGLACLLTRRTEQHRLVSCGALPVCSKKLFDLETSRWFSNQHHFTNHSSLDLLGCRCTTLSWRKCPGHAQFKKSSIVECGIRDEGWHSNYRDIWGSSVYRIYLSRCFFVQFLFSGTHSIVSGQMHFVQPGGHQLYPFSSSSKVVICPRQHVRNRTSHVHTIQNIVWAVAAAHAGN